MPVKKTERVITIKYTAGQMQKKVKQGGVLAQGEMIKIKDVRCKCMCEHCWETVRIAQIKPIGTSYVLYYVERIYGHG